MAEIELSSFNNHGLPERVPTLEQMRRETKAWAERRNEVVKKINWQFTTAESQVKLA
jgi:hypothetical protein